MDRYLRYVLYVLCLVQFITGISFALQIPLITQIWPIPNTSPLSFIFIGSIFLAAVASTLWPLFDGEIGSLVGIFLDYLVILTPISIYFFQIANGNQAIILYGASLVLDVFFGLFFLWWALRHPIKDQRSQPLPVRIAFIIFSLALIYLGAGQTSCRGRLPRKAR